MNILKKLPKRIKTKPSVSINKQGERFAIIDFIMYKILNDNIDEKDLLMVWYNTKQKNDNNSSIKNIIMVKNSKKYKLKIINDTELYCNCSEFENNEDCHHIKKLKKFFDIK
jgi:hypothetical protein